MQHQILHPSALPPSFSWQEVLRLLAQRELGEIGQARDFLTDLYAVREEEQRLLHSLELASPGSVSSAQGSAVPPVAHRASGEPTRALPAQAPVNHAPPKRRTMRPPRPGTTRALIYEVLSVRQGEPCHQAEIVREVAALRALPPEECEQAVKAVLKNRFDPHLRKIAPGEYAFVGTDENGKT